MRTRVLFIVTAAAFTTTSAKELIHLGHTTEIAFVRKCGDYLLSRDVDSNWILWDFDEKKPIIRGVSGNVNMYGSTVAVVQLNATLVYNLPSLEPLTIPYRFTWLTSDGEYLWHDSAGIFRFSDRHGTTGLTVPTNFDPYNDPQVIYAENRLFITAKGYDSILSYATPSLENPQTIKFAGTFVCWMKEGETFLSIQQDTLYLCGIDGTSTILAENIPYPYTVDGSGSYVWWMVEPWEGFEVLLAFHRLENAGVTVTDIGSRNQMFKCDRYFGNIPYYSKLNSNPWCWDASGGPLIIYRLDTDSIRGYMHRRVNFKASAFDFDSSGNWVVGNSEGLIICGTAEDTTGFTFFNDGCMRSVYGTPTNKLAIATASGTIISYDFSSGNGVATDTVIQSSADVKLSKDGSKLFSMSYICKLGGLRSEKSLLSIYTSASDTPVMIWRSNAWSLSEGIVNDFSISEDGNVISWVIDTVIIDHRDTKAIMFVDSQKQYFTVDSFLLANPPSYPAPRLSPSGRFSAQQCDTVVKVRRDSTLVTLINGTIGGWISDSILIINQYPVPVFRVNGDTLPGWRLTDELFNVKMISDSIIFYTAFENLNATPYYLANIHQCTVLCSLSYPSQVKGPACPVGSDYIVFQSDTALEWVNWHDLVSATIPGQDEGMKGPAQYINQIIASGNRISIHFCLSSPKAPVLRLFTFDGRLMAKTVLTEFKPGNHSISILRETLLPGKRTDGLVCVVVFGTGTREYAAKLIW
ncbi:MAG: hypothetical protein JW863_21505 [Chitinispirillaceae bacterium]|nr:hypothetical protein [Chitinispirillaceae bacterium]